MERSHRRRDVDEIVGIARSVLSHLDLEAVLEHVLDAARELTGAQYAAVGVLDASRTRLERFVTRGDRRGHAARDRPAAARGAACSAS